MSRNLSLVFVILFAVGAQSKDREGVTLLEGQWKVVSLVNDGKEAPKKSIQEGRLIFKGIHFEMKGGEEEFRGTFRLNPDVTPRQIDTVYIDVDNKEKGRALGIYELKGDELRIAWTQDSKDRPTTFASKPGSKVRLIEVKRFKP